MRQYIRIILTVFLAIQLTSCGEEFLDFVPEDQPTVDGWYNDADEIRQATAALYGRPWFEFNDVLSWCVGDLMAGDMFHNWDEEGQFFYASFNENNTHIANGWQSLYDVVSFANLIIDDMPGIAGSNGVSDADINAGLGEARFFRAAAYYYLVEYWGEVPIIESPAEKVANQDLFLPKNTLGSVYEFIRRDLVFAAENLPEADAGGRVTEWAAKGMLAKLHVTLGQRAAGGNSVGSLEDFTTAAGYAADVINNSGLVLFPDYESMFLIENEQNPEILFALRFINAGWGFGNAKQARFARNSIITGDPQAWGGGKSMSVDFINTLQANAESAEDARRRAIYMQNGDFYDYINVVNGGYTYQIIGRDENGTEIENQAPTLTNLKKHVVGNVEDHGFIVSNQDSPFDVYMLRLADVYLIYAEALMGQDGSLSSGPGYDAYLAVRSRAGLATPSDNEMSFRDLFNERRIEFGLEAMAWLDIKRQYYRDPQGTLDLLNAQSRSDQYFRIDVNDNMENDPDGYELVRAGESGTANPANQNTEPQVTFTANRMSLPIPGNEVVMNPLLRPQAEPVEYEFE
ncbi:RagB/SusD family nutrient uptake outer membrane protein [Fulvivirga sp. M361]|uniref:RagB/SusD family nutrient uptake outer membrane protein n=1 Tax=Fulvivirga sp. M361 TaxID=2594266 RepID=UPI00117B2AC4|nr:RagB/SusD family nutrient uptake outer membrane protein [Fulvivirga sp. M361]TRX50027.1 RagB/SusD family nutrient uptake outer membrane protein [Fulvivirga sp. M361]